LETELENKGKRLTMKPTAFKGSNSTLLGGPAERYGTADDVADLPVYREPGYLISCWQMTWRERLRVLWTGRVWLHVAGATHPPVVLGTEAPFYG
jgi:hypothetical protein